MSEVLLYDESVAWSGAVVGELRKGGGGAHTALENKCVLVMSW